MAKLNVLVHVIFNVLYALLLLNTGVNMFFPLMILKTIGVPGINQLLYKIMMLVRIYSNYLVLRILGIKMKIYKDKSMPPKKSNSESVLVKSNHLCELDPLFVGVLFGRVLPNNLHTTAFVKHSVRYYPLINYPLIGNDTIFVQNHNKEKNDSQHKYIVKKLKNRDNQLILIFPEGTTYCEKIKNYRESKSKERNTPTYNNLLIPKTNGLHLIHKSVEVDDDFYVVMKFVKREEHHEPSLNGLFKGHTPGEVHIFVKKRQELCKSLMEPENRLLFNKSVYNDFDEVDQILDKSVDEWAKEFKNEEVKILWSESLIFYVLTLLSGLTVYSLFTNRYYIYYFLLANLYYYLSGVFEMSNIKKMEKKIYKKLS